jgi:hypothetical protein
MFQSEKHEVGDLRHDLVIGFPAVLGLDDLLRHIPSDAACG